MENIQTKKCTECLADIPLKAKKCSHCGSKQKAVTPKSVKIILLILLGGPILFSVIMSAQIATKDTSEVAVETSSFGDYESVNVGDEAVLWVEHDEGTRGLICIAGTQEEYKQIERAINAKDYLGITEGKTSFCVGSGTKVLLIEKDFPLRRVRIVQGAGEVDNDKVGLSGWTAMEYVAKQ